MFDGPVTLAIRKIKKHPRLGANLQCHDGKEKIPQRRRDAAMEILLVEDDTEIATHVVRALTAAGLGVETADNGHDGLARARAGKHAALILDRMLPGMDGLTITRHLRAQGMQTPILLLTTMTGIDDRVEGLEGGADDYLVKPFALAELQARVGAMMRRAEAGAKGVATRLSIRDLRMDLIARTVHRGERLIALQAQEFRLLEYMMRNAGRAVTRTMLLEHVWNLDFDPRTNIVETHMSRLRSKLEFADGPEMIRTIRGTGYILRAD
jgi:two-component system OmpR family response regulator